MYKHSTGGLKAFFPVILFLIISEKRPVNKKKKKST